MRSRLWRVDAGAAPRDGVIRAFDTRPWVLVPTALLITAWAGIGWVTGHMVLCVGRGVVHFQGLAALVLSLSALALAAACVSPLGAAARRLTRSLLWVCVGLLGLAVALKVLGGGWLPAGPRFTGLVSEPALRRWLDQPHLAAWGAQAASGAATWLKWSCIVLLVVALLGRWIGLTKASFQNVPRLAWAAVIVFGSPFLAWFTLDGLPYLFSTVPARQPAESFMADAAFALSMLAVLLWAWWWVGLGWCLVQMKARGVHPRWGLDGLRAGQQAGR